MERLIDADKLADEFYHMPELVYTDAIARCIEMQPTVDAVKVVRCKDCKLRYSSEYCECRPDDFYCGDGERKDGEKDADIKKHT